MDNHNQSFFGQSTALILQSSSKSDPSIFFQCIKKKSNGKWEKPSKGEGKNIKCSMEEIVMILQVLNKKEESWSTYHKFKDINTQISFSWDPNDNKKLWIHIGEYSKMLDFAQIEILCLLLTHILEEKIIFATASNETDSNKQKNQSKSNNKITGKISKSQKKKNTNYNQKLPGQIRVEESIEPLSSNPHKTNKNNEKVSKVIANIKKETEKALLLKLTSGNEIWIPKSSIKSNFIVKKDISQTFLVDEWIISKNSIAV
ncbi:MAG: hypothetical protein ACQERB_13420 [Promethearchaeati archaeon]